MTWTCIWFSTRCQFQFIIIFIGTNQKRKPEDTEEAVPSDSLNDRSKYGVFDGINEIRVHIKFKSSIAWYKKVVFTSWLKKCVKPR